MNTPLFLDAKLTIDGQEKYAGMMTRMSDNTELWPQEITQEAYKQLPYLSDFEPTVILDKVDEERGFAFGSIEVRPKTAMTMAEQQVSPLKKVHIPLVVRDQQLCPLDVFMVGNRYHHLTEGRLRTSLFRADTFDAARVRPYDPSLVGDLMPPMRGNYGGGVGGGAKVASVLPLLPQLHGRVEKAHVDRLQKLASEDVALRATLKAADEGVQAAFLSAMGLEPSDPVKTAEALEDVLKPSAVQFHKLENGNVLVKWANYDMYAPQQEEMPQAQAQELAGPQDLGGMEPGDTLTAAPESTVDQSLDQELSDIRPIDQFGLWQVQNEQGDGMIGWVFPTLLSLSMEPLPLALFTNGSNYAVQELVVGKLAGKSTDIPKGAPAGYGSLYFIDHGTAKAFIPMSISAVTRDPNGLVKYIASTDMGEQVTFSFADGFKVPVRVSEDEYIIPTDIHWLPLKGRTTLVSAPDLFTKVSSAVRAVEIFGDSGSYTFRGVPLCKLALDQRQNLTRQDAEFLGVLLGMSPAFTKTALDRARTGQLVEVRGLRTITPANEKLAAARHDAREEIKTLDIRNYFLAKEAALLDNAIAADRILGLGFLNAENIADFVAMLPGLEETSSQLAELLVAVRIGLKDIPEVAVERMLVALEDVIRGLRALQQKEVGFEE